MKKRTLLFLCAVLAVLLLSACGRNDITLTVNKDGSIDAEVVYGIDKSLVAGDDVLKQVTQLITQPLNENNIKFTEKDSEDFYRITVTKSFKNAAELTDSAQWQGIPFVPQFTPSQAANAITVTAEKGKINFKGTLNSDSFQATQMLSDNKKAFGASITIKAKKATANIKETKKDIYKWEGTADTTVELELSAQYKGEELKPVAPEKASDEPKKTITAPDEADAPTKDNPKNSENTQVKAKEQDEKQASIPVAACAAVIIILLLLTAYKIKKLTTIKKRTTDAEIISTPVNEQQKGDDDSCR